MAQRGSEEAPAAAVEEGEVAEAVVNQMDHVVLPHGVGGGPVVERHAAVRVIHPVFVVGSALDGDGIGHQRSLGGLFQPIGFIKDESCMVVDVEFPQTGVEIAALFLVFIVPAHAVHAIDQILAQVAGNSRIGRAVPDRTLFRQVVVLGVLLERVVSGIGMKAAPKV